MQGGPGVTMGWGRIQRRGRHRTATVAAIRDPLTVRIAACEAQISGLYVTMDGAAKAAGIIIPGHEATKPMPKLELVRDDDVADSA